VPVILLVAAQLVGGGMKGSGERKVAEQEWEDGIGQIGMIDTNENMS